MKARIGLEVHVQVTGAGSKLFCGCSVDYRGKPPNTNVCPVCLGLPGALPVVNKRVVELALRVAIALNCRIPEAIVFTRKHYFYPDLPKGYQISMYERAGGIPVCLQGRLRYLDPHTWEWREVGIRRINIEEDPGRSVYDGDIVRSPYVYVDYNRSGIPLLEIVTEPDLRDPRDARAFLEYLLLTLEHLGVTNPRLEGAFRADANISLDGGERVEVKNIGSLADVEKALSYEIARQSKIIETGGRVERETRHWDSARGITIPLRRKETEEEYLYFPDPDLPPIPITREVLDDAARDVEEHGLESLVSRLSSMNLQREIVWSLIQSKAALQVYLEAVKLGANPALAARILAVDYKGVLKEMNADPYSPESYPPAETLAELSRLVERGDYPYDTIKGLVLPRLAYNPRARLDELLPAKTSSLEEYIEATLREEERAVRDYLAGKREALNYLVGATIRRIGRKAVDPREVRRLLEEKLERIKSARST